MRIPKIKVTKEEKRDFPLNEMKIDPFWEKILIMKDNEKSTHTPVRHSLRSEK